MPASSLENLSSHYSVLIIGAGINGCGTFRDLNLQGVDCLLIDRGDICSGASAAPSRLIHGGIKYLETHEFRLVKESAMERNRLLNNAPHYVKALEVVIPARSWFAGLAPAIFGYLGFNTRIKERGALLIELGLQIYDFYSRKVKALPNHQFYGRDRLRNEFPEVPSDSVAAGLYYEARVTHAERLGLEVAQDGLAVNPKSALSTYTQVKGAPQGGKLMLEDTITGDTREVTADVVINAGGAWIDKVNAGLGIATHYIGGSKGSHLIVRSPALLKAMNGRMMYFGTSDGRFNLIYPFFGNALIGSTDKAVADADQARCSTEEADYMLAIVGEIFPRIKVTREDVILTYNGVRPLPRANGKDIGDVSRDHSIARDLLPGTTIPILSLIGGKWTTFRAFSEQSAGAVLALLKRTRKCSTVDRPIGGGKDYPRDDRSRAEFIRTLKAGDELGATLFDRYGTAAKALRPSVAAHGDRMLSALPGYSVGEIDYICKNETVRRLADLLLRRTSITMEGLLDEDVITETATIAAKALGWDANRKTMEIDHAKAELARRSVHATKPE
jgi:glycerol-3-phosphate dehydrogenase